MPKRADIRKILIIGSGPIVIGQACEFDYSGTQACKALKEEGFTLVLVNSNPATIMTDPEFSHRTYLEPLVPRVLARIIEIERPDALLPTIGGQTALNAAVDLAQMGVLDQFHVEMIGANVEAIRKAEDRGLFRDAMVKIGLDVPRSHVVHDEAGADAALADLGLPLVIRPAFTLGGTGGGIARQRDDYRALARRGLEMSPVREVLVEEALIGWKEFEMEVMRDRNDNVVIICSIENFDPMSVHTGDSITVAPAQTLTDKEMQRMRDASIACIREVGVDTGGSNIQFAVHPGTGRMVIIEMNPRVSRSSALASKATGYPIARIAAKLAVGYTLDEIPNDITRKTPASFEPAIDYVVTKAPRFTFEKFPGADAVLTTQMKSVGEAMAIGRTFKESFQKALRSLETAHFGLGLDRLDRLAKGGAVEAREVRERLATPNAERPWYLRYAFKAGMSVREMHDLTAIDPWFLENIREIVAFEETLRAAGSLEALDADTLREAKRLGFSDVQIATLFGRPEPEVRARRAALGVRPVYKLVDTCAAEFEAYTPYYYSTYEEENEVRVTSRPKIVVLGGGPNRIGQGIEFDYCCVHASFALRELGYESIMINSNPETVSTDYDTSDHLFFEPLTVEDVLAVCETVKAEGVIVQFGGQTPLNLAKPLFEAGVKIVGTSIDSIDRAEDRGRFSELVESLHLRQPASGTARTLEEARKVADRLGFPVLVRPSYVLGGRAMEICDDQERLGAFVSEAARASPDHPILIDKYIEEAVEVDVDAIADGETVVVGGVMEHIEEAGIHSGDSTCTLPAFSLRPKIVDEIRRQTHALARALEVRGLMNIQFAVKDDLVYILEVNPRASRTVPFVCKATGVPLAKLATKVMVGRTLRDLGFTKEPRPALMCVKMPVFPWAKFQGADIRYGPEMRSTGEVMGMDQGFGTALAKAQMGALFPLPTGGKVFISVRDSDKHAVLDIAGQLVHLGFELLSTAGTHRVLTRNGIAVTMLRKISEGKPNLLELLIGGEVAMVINTPSGFARRRDEMTIRRETILRQVPLISTIAAARAALEGIQALQHGGCTPRALQDFHPAASPLA